MTEPLRIVFLDRDTLPEAITVPTPGFPHTLEVHQRTRARDVAARIANADIVITNKVPIRADALTAAPNLKLIAVAATGYDIIDIAACRDKGVAVHNIRGYAVHTVPEHTFALMLALRRSIVPYRQSVRGGRWQDAGQFCYFDYPINNLAGSTLGIVGSGTLGSSVARIAEAFGMKVLFAGRKSGTTKPDQTPFAEVIAQADVLTLHCPLNDETRNLIGVPEFAAMKPTALLINTARGGLVDEVALLKAIQSDQIAGAGIDVTTPEPPAAGSTIMQLADHPKVIVTPHVGWAGHEAIQTLADQLIENIELFIAGKPRNLLG